MTSPLPTIINECELRPIVRTYYPDFMTMFLVERSDFDYEPDLIDVCDEVFECSLMDESTFAKIKGITLFVALMYPFTLQHSMYKLINKVYMYLFIVDDHMEGDWNAVRRDPTRGRETFSQLISMTDKLERPDEYVSMATWKPYCIAYYAVNEEVFEEAVNDYNDVRIHRMIYCIRDYIQGNLIEYGAVEDGIQHISLEQFLHIRIKSAAGLLAIHITEFAGAICLTTEEWDQPLMQALIISIGKQLVLQNEIYSFEKEFLVQNKRLEKTFNLVTLMALKHGFTVAEAMAEVTALEASEEAKSCNIMMKFNAEPSFAGNVKLFVDYINPLVGGSYKSHALLDRYNKI